MDNDSGPKRSLGMISLALGGVGLCAGLGALVEYARNMRDARAANAIHGEAKLVDFSETPKDETPASTSMKPEDPFAARKKELTPQQYYVTQEAGTERPFTNEYDKHFEPGIYVDIVSGKPLFTSLDKFDSGCGWPAFSKPAQGSEIVEHKDVSAGMIRTEVRSKTANSHLGHVFDDGPAAKGGLRYCINSASLRFVPVADLEKEGFAEYLPLFAEKPAP